MSRVSSDELREEWRKHLVQIESLSLEDSLLSPEVRAEVLETQLDFIADDLVELEIINRLVAKKFREVSEEISGMLARRREQAEQYGSILAKNEDLPEQNSIWGQRRASLGRSLGVVESLEIVLRHLNEMEYSSASVS